MFAYTRWLLTRGSVYSGMNGKFANGYSAKEFTYVRGLFMEAVYTGRFDWRSTSNTHLSVFVNSHWILETL